MDIELLGLTRAGQTATGTNNVVTAVANVNGVIIHDYALRAGAGSHAILQINGVDYKKAEGTTDFVDRADGTRKIKIPAGQAVDLNVNNQGEAVIYYQVLS